MHDALYPMQSEKDRKEFFRNFGFESMLMVNMFEPLNDSIFAPVTKLDNSFHRTRTLIFDRIMESLDGLSQTLDTFKETRGWR